MSWNSGEVRVHIEIHSCRIKGAGRFCSSTNVHLICGYTVLGCGYTCSLYFPLRVLQLVNSECGLLFEFFCLLCTLAWFID